MKPKLYSELRTTKEKVHFLLIEIPKLRDSDSDLIATYILKEIGEEVKQMSALELLAKISNSRLSSFETIRRARIDVQNEFNELKGSEFGKRRKSVKQPLFKINIRET